MKPTNLCAAVVQVNLSPNLSSTRHKPLAALFSNVISDLLRLIGFGQVSPCIYSSSSPLALGRASSSDSCCK